MPEKTKPEKKEQDSAEKSPSGTRSDRSEDRQKKNYYYDDACGYEVYKPDEEDAED